MALEHEICFISTLEDCSQIIFEDITIYGNGGNSQRHEIAIKYLGYKVDQHGQQTLLNLISEPNIINITGQINLQNYISDKIVMPSSLDGWVLLVGLNINIWNNSDNYTKQIGTENNASIIYYSPLDKIYKAIQDNNNIAPDAGGGTLSWEEIIDFEALIENTSLITFKHNDIVVCRLEKAYSKELAKNALEGLCNSCKTFKEIEKSDNLNLWLNSIYSANNNELYSEGEKISRSIDSKL